MEELEEMLDELQALRAKKDALVAMLDEQIETKRARLEVAMQKASKTKIKTAKATAFYQKSTEIKVDDWNNVMDFVVKNKATDILQKRISAAALEQRIKAGEKIPGVTVTKGQTFVIRQVKEKEDAEQDS